jgi:hypothetical protein
MTDSGPDRLAALASNQGLVAAVRRWQSGQDGSSLLRGAARAITGVAHYFDADFIAEYERRAALDQLVRTQARLLMDEIGDAGPWSAHEWHARLGLSGEAFAGRGIKSKPQHDAQILASLARGKLTMPLWGFSLRRDVAASYGTRFLFQIDGPFHGLPAWLVTDEQEDQAEIIASGSYEVSTEDQDESTIVTLREAGPVRLSAELMAMMDAVVLGGIYRTNTLILPDYGDPWASRRAAPPGLKVRVVRIRANGPDVEALEAADGLEAGTVFFCPAGNLIPVDPPSSP